MNEERDRVIKLLRTNIELKKAMEKKWIRWMYSSFVGLAVFVLSLFFLESAVGKAGYYTGMTPVSS